MCSKFKARVGGRVGGWGRGGLSVSTLSLGGGLLTPRALGNAPTTRGRREHFLQDLTERMRLVGPPRRERVLAGQERKARARCIE